jgi:peptide/nickel transport system permease protein
LALESNPARDHWRRTRKFLFSAKGSLGLALIILFTILPYLQPYIVPYPPFKIGVGAPNQAPSSEHLLGTTSLGQDVLSQFLAGGLVSVVVGVLTGIFASLLAAAIGIPAGYFRGKYGGVLTLLTDVFLVIPILPLIIVFAIYLGPSVSNQILILTLLTWPFTARVISSQVLSLRERGFVESAVLAGGSSPRIMLSEILPNLVPLILSNGVLVIVFAILFQAAIAFLGLGIPTLVSWGSMLYYAELSGAIAAGEWWWVAPPGLGIMLLAFAFSLIILQLDDVLSDWTKLGRV